MLGRLFREEFFRFLAGIRERHGGIVADPNSLPMAAISTIRPMRSMPKCR
jgi:hypothetical protein